MRHFTKGIAALLLAASLTSATGAAAQGTLRIRMTVSDIPLTTGHPIKAAKACVLWVIRSMTL